MTTEPQLPDWNSACGQIAEIWPAECVCELPKGHDGPHQKGARRWTYKPVNERDGIVTWQTPAASPAPKKEGKKMNEPLAKYGHHPDPEIDAGVEVDRLQGLLMEAHGGLLRGLDYRAATPEYSKDATDSLLEIKTTKPIVTYECAYCDKVIQCEDRGELLACECDGALRRKTPAPATKDAGLPPPPVDYDYPDPGKNASPATQTQSPSAELLATIAERDAALARIKELESERDERNKRMHGKFGFVPSPDGSGKCACAYCVGDVEALADCCADQEMQLFLPGGWKDRAEVSESKVAELESALREHTERQEKSFDEWWKVCGYFIDSNSHKSFARAVWLASGQQAWVPVLAAAKRLASGKVYPKWETAGGPNECEHGIAAGIPCAKCDHKLVFPEDYDQNYAASTLPAPPTPEKEATPPRVVPQEGK